MKRISFFLIGLFSIGVIQAQNISDGLRYSTEQKTATARFTALSGAMGALGGDLSAMSVNPAGSAVFLNSNVTVSASVYDVENQANYFNTGIKNFADDISLNQAGGVFVFNNSNEESRWRKFSIGVNYETSRNFENELYIAGIGNTSIADFFLSQAQGIPLNLLQIQTGQSISDRYNYLGANEGTVAQNAFLGYQAFLFDPVDANNSNNTSYLSNVSGGSFDQEYTYLTQGYNSKFSINFGTQVTDNFFFGINLNTHNIDYRRSTFLFETNNNAGSTVNRIGFENNLSVLGSGLSAQIGAIAKVAENFRFGLSLDTPTWYIISEETTQYLESRRVENGQSITEIVDPRVINVYEDYNLSTPGKVTASAAYIFGQNGLISFDYSYKDFSKTEFHPTDDSYFRSINNSIDTALKGVSSYKAGGEYRIDQLSLRGGFHYEESPYKDKNTLGELMGFSLGAGYNFGKLNLDLAYSRSEQDRNQQLYSEGLTDSAKINTIYSNFIASLSFAF